jgi:hypothetical protein
MKGGFEEDKGKMLAADFDHAGFLFFNSSFGICACFVKKQA